MTCDLCHLNGEPCPRCERLAETRADAAREPVNDLRDTRAERVHEARIYGRAS